MADIKLEMEVRDIPETIEGEVSTGRDFRKTKKSEVSNPDWCSGSENVEYVLKLNFNGKEIEYPGKSPEESYRMLLTNMAMHEPDPDFLEAIMDEVGFQRSLAGWVKKPKKQKKPKGA
jgi:hypothetical protein